MATEQMRNDRMHREMFDEALVFMGLSSPTGIKDYPPSYFGGAFMGTRTVLGEIRREAAEADRDRLILERIGPIDVSLIFAGGNDTAFDGKTICTMTRARQLNFEEKSRLVSRGYGINRMSLVAKVVMAEVVGHGHYRPRVDHYAADLDRGTWSLAECPTIRAARSGAGFYNMAINPEMMIMFTEYQLVSETKWAVEVGYEGSPSVRFITDPTGIREIFRSRDAPEGADRREALRNWVRAHWREDRKDSDVEVEVRKHLRGQSSFTWHGLRARIHVPIRDQAEERKAAADRELSRFLRRDRRPRDPASLRRKARP